MSEFKIPTKEEILKAIEEWSESDKQQDIALTKLFTEIMPKNDNLNEVLIKVASLNAFYSTQINNNELYEVAKQITLIKDIDRRLISGDLTIVNEITYNGATKKIYSFATKYCSFHNPKVYPIYDSAVDKMLWNFQKMGKMKSFKHKDLNEHSENRYEIFCDIIADFINTYNLGDLSIKQVDQYLWITGK